MFLLAYVHTGLRLTREFIFLLFSRWSHNLLRRSQFQRMLHVFNIDGVWDHLRVSFVSTSNPALLLTWIWFVRVVFLVRTISLGDYGEIVLILCRLIHGRRVFYKYTQQCITFLNRIWCFCWQMNFYYVVRANCTTINVNFSVTSKLDTIEFQRITQAMFFQTWILCASWVR